MSDSKAPRPEPVPIGDVVAPPFVRLPDAASLFHARAERLRWLAQRHDLKAYLLFLAGLADIQHRLQAEVPLPALPEAGQLQRAREFRMPPLDRTQIADGAGPRPALEGVLALARELEMPEPAMAALLRLAEASDAQRQVMIRAVLAPAIPADRLAEHGFVAAALQVHFAQLTGQLDPGSLVPVGDGACPSCGFPPAGSMVVGWLGSHGARYCGCALCGTLWNYVRIKCTICGSTEGIAYQEIEGTKGRVKAETCTHCHSYVKLLQQDVDPATEILADDVASLGLDLLMRDTDFRRGGVNPFLLGY
jgi:FdhE protein